MAVVDYFLKVQGIDGECQEKNHKNWIDIYSFSWGATNAGTAAVGGGAGAGKVAMQDFHFVMNVNKASPKLLLACANGDHIAQAILVCRKAGKEQQEYLKWTFSDLMISSFQTGGGTRLDPSHLLKDPGDFRRATSSYQGEGQAAGDIVPTDEITFNYSKLEYEYKQQNADGTLGGATKVSLDVKAMVFS